MKFTLQTRSKKTLGAICENQLSPLNEVYPGCKYEAPELAIRQHWEVRTLLEGTLGRHLVGG